ncbi:MAG: tetratricopeptide repeat protein [Candidatus Eremiobacteraeota bacterium]|nr:tetratricopeptide repeat protein [Candidatus Eremiobacteraeota bacterium]
MAESLAELLYRFRLAMRLSQEALAERAGVSARTVSDIETGTAQRPRLMTLMLLAEALGLRDEDRKLLQSSVRRTEPQPAEAHSPQRPQIEPLVGRGSEVERLSGLLTPGGARLVTLVGPAGVGKTALALRVAHDRAAAFEDPAVIVELALIRDAAHVPAAVAKALGVREAGGASVREVVRDHLERRNALLLLDNFEHVMPAAAWIGELLKGCPRISVLATSREMLRLRSELVVHVRTLDKSDAVELFVQRARAVKPEFTVTDEVRGSIATIVDHLDGLPLALELAAARLNALPLRALAARLERRLPLLGGGPIDAPRRQQTMNGAIAWSYDLLSAEEQALFRGLGVFRGGATVEGARSVVAAEDDAHTLFLRVASLVDKSLISFEEDAEGEPRIAMLELLREFADERLAEMGELAGVRHRHACFALQIAGTYDAERAKSGGQAAARVELEHPNLIAALEWLSETHGAELGLRIVAALWHFWWTRGHFSLGIGWLRHFLQLADRDGVSTDARVRAKAVHGLVSLLSAAGSLTEALSECQHAIEVLRKSQERAGLASLLTSLGNIQQFRGELTLSEAAHQEALCLRQELGDDAGVAISLSHLAGVTYTQGAIDRSDTYARESVALYRRLGRKPGLAHALLKAGFVATERKELDHAQAIFEESLRIQRDLGDRHGSAYSLGNLGIVAYKRGDTERAVALYRETLDIFAKADNKSALAKALEDTALAIARSDPERGVRILAAADTLRQTIGAPRFPAEKADYEEELAGLRRAVGNDTFETEWRIGALMSQERALEEARCTTNGAARERATPSVATDFG